MGSFVILRMKDMVLMGSQSEEGGKVDLGTFTIFPEHFNSL